MKRAGLLALVGLLAFIHSSAWGLGCVPSAGVSSGYCTVTLFFKYTTGPATNFYSVIVDGINDCYSIASHQKGGDNTTAYPASRYYVRTYRWSGTSWSLVLEKLWHIQDTDYAAARAKFEAVGAIIDNGGVSPAVTYPTGLPDCGVQGPCQTADDDGDGVCNSCDKSPGAPDPQDCIYLSSRNSSGQIVDMIIDEGCTGNTGDNLASYRNEENAAVGDGRLYYDLSANETQMQPKTCDGSTGADADGNCNCSYPVSNTQLAGFTDNSGNPAVSQTAIDEYENAQNLNNQNQLDNCASVRNRCESACAAHGGVGTNTCNDEGGRIRSSCVCNQDLAYDLDNESSNDNPDTTTDSDGDGVPNALDPDSTGGQDSNGDNVDDIAAAISGAIASLGLGGKLDSVNQNLDSIGNSVSGLGNKIDGVGNKIDALGSKIDGVGDAVNGIKDLLEEGFEVTGSAALPDANTYDSTVAEVEEISFVDTVHGFINSSMPILSSITESGLTASGSPTMATEIWGKSIVIDFSDWQGVLRAAGLVLVAIATIIAFMIII